ncbi:hypothetical protein E4U24_005986 [Claviceps purpurea]|nr:hypothetical protein E4U11_003506 [Claviceps purpurea]KAG6163502.1 hypothetical protein E4U51_005670 [Claviceps purpurea]KAG6175829.1 hypothetical protein E4U27_005778 [Claviceps purpurea]KAG6229005.1 hypothetical protein E4U26_000581 [Claviceps purpurea]KAG6242404.1 hypothetical protein E4U25_003997 [Claviceps purpurea]
MVKILSIFVATLAAISPVVQAGACTPGLQYCGSTLTRYGVKQAWEVIADALYSCQRGGTVALVSTCIDCQDKGAGRNDLCLHW